jgi:peptidyl-prolyl cis-trans isomerase C
MKFPAILVIALWGVAHGQTPPAPQPPVPQPPAAQTPPPELPDLPDDTVIAQLDDHTNFTMGDVRKYLAALPPESRPMAMRDPKTWIQSWSRMLQMAHMAEKEKLDERSPTKEQLEFQKLLLLAQAEMQDKLLNTDVDSAEIAKEYDSTKDKYKQVKVNAIYIAFGDKGPNEAQAKAKAEKLLAQIRKNADFAKLARENSDDETSKAKDGYFATLTPSDNIPDALRAAVFQLKEGETSEPVRQPNGFYLLRAEQITYKPLAQVRDQIFSDVKNKKFQEWLNDMAKQAEPKFVNPTFPPQAKSPAK